MFTDISKSFAWSVALAMSTVCLLASVAVAQFEFPSGPAGFSGLESDDSSSDVTVTAEFIPANGDAPAQLSVTAKIPEGFHIYAMDQSVLPDNGGGPMATRIMLDPSSPVKLLGPWQPSQPPETHVDTEIWVGLELREQSGQITWTAPVELIAGAQQVIAGKVEGQACNPHTCVPFEQKISVLLAAGLAAESNASRAPETEQHTLSPRTESASTSKELYDLSRVTLANDSTEAENSIVYYLVIAFLGGLILNVMPCVLPVIGLKVMSFVQQAGQSRVQAWVLNCWYSAGIVSVFLVLATLAVSLQIGWGSHFASSNFNITLIAVVFAMALSLLGVWEIPIPGFAGSSTANKAAEKEGPTGAFLKGVLTTLLATPCIGPFLTPALTWALQQPMWISYSVFAVLGLGMASPYLLIGAYPSLVRFLPKPGAWMETFKKITGFILMATVIWLMTTIDFSLVIPTVVMLLGISLGCWWISQTSITAPRLQKVYAWTTATLLVVVSLLVSYGLLHPVMQARFQEKVAISGAEQAELKYRELALELANVQSLEELQGMVTSLEETAIEDTGQPWQHFSLAKLSKIAIDDHRTVIVDFTADWCVTCKALEKLVLKTEPVERAISETGVVSLEADYTKRPPAIEQTIKALGGIGVPLVAIFPASDPYRPIVFANGSYTQEDLLKALSKATGKNLTPQGSLSPEQTSLTQATEIEPRF